MDSTDLLIHEGRKSPGDACLLDALLSRSSTMLNDSSAYGTQILWEYERS